MAMMFRVGVFVKPVLAGAIVLGLSGCGGQVPSLGSLFGGDDSPPLETRAPEDIMEQATASLRDNKPRTAAFLFDEVERLYPYSDDAKDAMLMSAEASYRANDYDKAIVAAERFIGFYPSDENTDRARYLIAQSHYEQIVDVGRDQGTTAEARQALEELIARHPDSEYAKDAELKLETALDQLAGKEMTIGRYYLKRGDWIAAINRFQTVVRDYDTTSHVEEALHRLVEANLAIGAVEEAKKAAAVLGHNAPGSDWYSNSYAMLAGEGAVPASARDSWYKRAYRQVILGQWL